MERGLDRVGAACGQSGLRVQRHASIGALTTYRLGGPASVLVRAGSLDELRSLAEILAGAFAEDEDLQILIVGRGSNLLVADAGFDGVAVVLDGELEEITIEADMVHAGGAVPLPVLARRSASAGRRGLEFFVGIPGSVGGAVAMNAGGHGSETADVLVDAVIVDLETAEQRSVRPENLDFSYRHSAITEASVVASARFSTEGDDPTHCEARIAEIVRWRREHQPGGANAGSVFKNPPGASAGALIDAAGLKGLRVGGAAVSTKHANFFQADPTATADDVAALVAQVQRQVQAHAGVTLTPELRMVGFAR